VFVHVIGFVQFRKFGKHGLVFRGQERTAANSGSQRTDVGGCT
jgi:hypothetical protein